MKTWILVILACLYLNFSISAQDEIKISLKNGTRSEQQTKEQLERLFKSHDLSKWTMTKSILIDEKTAIPHSHPVLTLNTSYLKDDELLLATYVHEQIHWFVIKDQNALAAAIKDFRAMFPTVPTSGPEGARDESSTYLHIAVCYLEYRAMRELMGELKAKQIMDFWATNHYMWIYRTVRDRPRDIGTIMFKHKLVPTEGAKTEQTTSTKTAPIENVMNHAVVTNDETNLLRTYGIKLNVDDMPKAKSFYVGKLGFEIDEERSNAEEAVLKTEGQVRLILKKVSRLRKTSETDTGISFTLQVNDLDEAIKRMRAAGVEFAENTPRKEGVGNAIYIRDPFGRKISLMHQTIAKVEPFKEPRIYNFGFYIPNMEAARDFYGKKLGFVERTDRYLPLDMPLGHADGTFGFMLHQRDGVTSIRNGYPDTMPYNMIVFETTDMSRASEIISKKGVSITDRKRSKNGGLQSIVLEDPFGNITEIIEVRHEARSVTSDGKQATQVRKFVEAFNKRDIDVMLGLVDENLQWLSVDGTKLELEARGKDALRQSMIRYFNDCRSCRSSLEWVQIAGSRITALERASWSVKDEIKTQSSLSVYEFHSGKILRVYYFPAEKIP